MKTLSLYLLRNHHLRQSHYCLTFGNGSDCVRKWRDCERGKFTKWDWKKHKITCERTNFQIKVPAGAPRERRTR